MIYFVLLTDMPFRAQSAPLEHKIFAEVMLASHKSTEGPVGQNSKIENNFEKIDESKAIIQAKKEENEIIETSKAVPKEAKTVESRKNEVNIQAKQAKPTEKPAPQKTIAKNEIREKHEENADKNTMGDNIKGDISSSAASQRSNKSESGANRQSGMPGHAAIATVDSVTVVNRVKPVYPQISRKRAEEGNVVLLAKVVNGKVVSVSIEKSSGIKALDASALTAVGKWSFSADTNTVVRIPVSFRLKD
jgi:TonB family protein